MTACSSPKIIQKLADHFRNWERECEQHDEEYGIGGSGYDRMKADWRLAWRVFKKGFKPVKKNPSIPRRMGRFALNLFAAPIMLIAVRFFGGFGGHFNYKSKIV